MPDKHPVDSLFAEKLRGVRQRPPAAVWERVSGARPARRRGGGYALAAAVAMLITAVAATWVAWPGGTDYPAVAGAAATDTVTLRPDEQPPVVPHDPLATVTPVSGAPAAEVTPERPRPVLRPAATQPTRAVAATAPTTATALEPAATVSPAATVPPAVPMLAKRMGTVTLPDHELMAANELVAPSPLPPLEAEIRFGQPPADPATRPARKGLVRHLFTEVITIRKQPGIDVSIDSRALLALVRKKPNP